MDNTQKHNILSRYCPHCVCARLNHYFSHLVGWRFALYLEQTCGSGQEQVKSLGSSGAYTAQFGQKLTCQKSVYRAMATGDIRVIDLLVHNTKHTQHSPLQCKNITIQCLNLYKLLHFCIIEVGFLLLFLVCVQVCLVLEGDSSTCPLPLLLPHMSGDIPLGTWDMVCSLLHVVVSLEVEAVHCVVYGKSGVCVHLHSIVNVYVAIEE